MQEFSRSVESERIREDLLDVIHGAGALKPAPTTGTRLAAFVAAVCL